MFKYLTKTKKGGWTKKNVSPLNPPEIFAVKEIPMSSEDLMGTLMSANADTSNISGNRINISLFEWRKIHKQSSVQITHWNSFNVS